MSTKVMEHVAVKDLPHLLDELHLDPKQLLDVQINIVPSKKTAQEPSKWAQVAERMAKENLLNGIGEEVLGVTQNFREDPVFRNQQSKT